MRGQRDGARGEGEREAGEFWHLADHQREARILVGVSGLSYDEAAQVCECLKGTIKSRVSRARLELLQILEEVCWLTDG